jgi:hypothetical protein
MGILTTTAITAAGNFSEIPIKELTARVIQRFESTYTGGEWNPDNASNWVPGSFVDFTPKRADSVISYIWRAPHAWSNAAHAISHWRFFVNGVLYYWHSVSGTHIEDGCTIKWQVPSWGTTLGRIGYQVRSYANDNHETRLYTTYYWNGTGRSAQNARGQLIVEEYAGISNAARADGETWIAR